MKYTKLDEFIDNITVKYIIGKKEFENPLIGAENDSLEKLEEKLITVKVGRWLTETAYEESKKVGKFKGIKGWFREKRIKTGVNYGKKKHKLLYEIYKTKKEQENCSKS